MREKGLQSIKKVIAEDYDKQLAQENKNQHLKQKSPDERIKKQTKITIEYKWLTVRVISVYMNK